MRTSTRRKIDMALVVAGVLVAGLVALVGAVLGHGEQVAAMWVGAELADDGSAQITEVIDYDFGSSFDKHGIFRVVPDLSPEAAISVSSDDAPDDLEITTETAGTRLRVGDPNTTVSGNHRYRIDYPLAGVAKGDQLDWDAVGTDWEVGIAEAEIHVVAPFELVDPQCFEGFGGSDEPCDVRQVEPGHLVATVDGLESGEGLSLEAGIGSDLAAAPALPEPPTQRPDHPGTGLIPPAGTAAAVALPAGIVVLVAVRRAGRERVGTGGAAEAAWAGSGNPTAPPSPGSEVRLDHDQLAEMATIEFAPPGELTPPQGGIVLAEGVRPNHKVAWLIDAAIEGSVELVTEADQGGATQLLRKAPGSPETAPILDAAFGGRDELTLGRYDPSFAAAWTQLDSQLDSWQSNSGLWDARADRRRLATRLLGVVGIVVGGACVLAGGAAAGRWGPEWLPVAAIGGLIFGAAVAATVAAWELHVRTVAGSAAWLRVESFRRFLAESEAYHAEEAAKRGVLREYTAWAVALDEIDRWSRAVNASTAIPAAAGLHYVHTAPLLYGATAAAATAPRSSGGGGGGGGSVGGGAGGGGGGSW
jgi:uncharacterized membrane protein YgcG